jgi:hypothetical protein
MATFISDFGPCGLPRKDLRGMMIKVPFLTAVEAFFSVANKQLSKQKTTTNERRFSSLGILLEVQCRGMC